MEVQFDDPIATIVMNEGKANALDPHVVHRLRDAFRKAQEGGARATILVGHGSAFSAGLNLPAISRLDRPRLTHFVEDFMELLVDMLGASTPLVAAINGHAVAGGCILALACDYRIMAHGDYRFGLNEINLGIRFPLAALEVALAALPRATWSEMLLRARFAGPEDAMGMGLVHQLADPAVLLGSARAVARDLASKPSQAMAHLRRDINGALIGRIRSGLEESAQQFVEAWFSEETQTLVHRMCEQLTGGIGSRGSGS